MIKKCLHCKQDFDDKTKSHCAKFCSIRCRSSFKRSLYAKWKANNIAKLAAYQAEYHQNNRDKRIAQNKEQKKKRADHYRKWFAANRLKKYHTDPAFKLRCILRSRLKRVLKQYSSEIELPDFGCSVQELKIHIESQFQPGMSWNNWSKHGWHVDHIKPLSSFDLTDPGQLKQANHYTNLQPLWAKENLRKGFKVNV